MVPAASRLASIRSTYRARAQPTQTVHTTFGGLTFCKKMTAAQLYVWLDWTMYGALTPGLRSHAAWQGLSSS